MSCWVVPTIAAEIWGVGVDHILQRVREGDLPYQLDEGFMFVDVDATAPPPPPPPPPPQIEHPPTFTVLSELEVEALEVLRDRSDQIPPSRHDDDADADEATEGSGVGDEASVELGDWRAARQRVARTRIPPAGQRAKPHGA